MTLSEYQSHRRRARWFWCAVNSMLWMWHIFTKASAAYGKKALAVASMDGWFARHLHAFDPLFAGGFEFALGLIGLIFMWMLAFVFGGLQAWLFHRADCIADAWEASSQRRAFARQMLVMEKDNDRQMQVSRIAQSKQELIMRLGNIDQYVRVLESEDDPSTKTVALQAAQSEITTLVARAAAGQIPSTIFSAAEVRAQATETSEDLVRLGLEQDRLNRDLVRLFGLKSKGFALKVLTLNS